MPLDRAFVGRVYPPSPPYEISREKIREFADAIGDENPIYRDRDAAVAAGYPDVIAPPTFLTIVNIKAINEIITDPDLGLDYGRMVHGDQKFESHRNVHAGDVIRVTAIIEEIMERAGNDFVQMRADVHTLDGELVNVCRAQLVVRGEDG